MPTESDPRVSVVTPVYNGEPYLRECIESVLAQSYNNWEYLILDNASTDHTARIAAEYAAADKRIRVVSNDSTLPIIANHNKAFTLLDPTSKYCKVVSADDWLFPDCISRLVAVAEDNPSAGVVGSYQLSGGDDEWYLRTDGLSYFKSLVPGKEICRAHLLGQLSVFGNPTSNLYRVAAMQPTASFYPNTNAEADVSACVACMRSWDFGFVHQVLSYERLHNNRMTTHSRAFNAYLSSRLNDLITYGTAFLDARERDRCVNDLLDEYYKFLAISFVNGRDREFWRFHKKRLADLGHPLSRTRLTRAVLNKIADLFFNPKQTVEKICRRAMAH